MSDEKKPHYNPEAPHQAVVLVKYENFERDDLGRCVARPSSKNSKVYTFTGKNYEVVQQQVESFLQRIENEKESTGNPAR